MRRIENVLAVEAGFLAGDDRAWGGPREAWIEVAARCNLRCVMCPITYDPRYQGGSGPEFLTPDRFAALEPIFPTLERAHLFGLGEPLLSPYLFDYARRLSGAGVEVWTTTNATLIGPAEAERLAAAGFRRVSVSIDGATPETYERIRKHGHFADAVAGIRALGEVKRRHGFPQLYLAMVAMASNLHELPALVDLAVEAGADGVHVSSLYAWEHPEIERLERQERLAKLGEAAVLAILAEARRRAEAHGLEFSSRVDLGEGQGRLQAGGRKGEDEPTPRQATTGAVSHRPAGSEHRPAPSVEVGFNPLPVRTSATGAQQLGADLPWSCSEPWSTINVNARGQVRTCCFNDSVLGTLGDGAHGAGIRDIWNGSPYRELRRGHASLETPDSCARCVRAGRLKLSPYLPSRSRQAPPSTTAPAVALRGRRPAIASGVGGPLPMVLAPGDGEPCAGRMVVIGDSSLPPPPRGLLRSLQGAPLLGRRQPRTTRGEQPLPLPEVRVNGELVGRVSDFGVTDGSRWAIAIELPFVSPGSHSLTVSAPAAAGGEQWAERRFQLLRPEDLEEDLEQAIVVRDRLAFCLELSQAEPSPRLAIAGRPRLPSAWICGTYGEAWRGFAVLDVDDLEAGAHTVEIELERHPAQRIVFRRIAVAPL